MSGLIKDISEALLVSMKACTALTTLVGSGANARISSPSFNREDVNPKVCYRQAGGTLSHRYAFRVRGDTIQSAKSVAMVIVNLFTQKAPDLGSGIGSVFGTLDSGIAEVYSEDEKDSEIFFNISFKFLES